MGWDWAPVPTHTETQVPHPHISPPALPLSLSLTTTATFGGSRPPPPVLLHGSRGPQPKQPERAHSSPFRLAANTRRHIQGGGALSLWPAPGGNLFVAFSPLYLCFRVTGKPVFCAVVWHAARAHSAGRSAARTEKVSKRNNAARFASKAQKQNPVQELAHTHITVWEHACVGFRCDNISIITYQYNKSNVIKTNMLWAWISDAT